MDHQAGGRASVCVVQNITPPWIASLGSAWDIEPEFFVAHAAVPPRDMFWQRPGHSLWQNEPDARRFYNVPGIFEYHSTTPTRDYDNLDLAGNNVPFPRPGRVEPENCLSLSTCISYVRVTERLYLFLTDATKTRRPPILGMQPPCLQTTLRLPFASNRGGLGLPQLYSKSSFSLSESLQSFLAHEWHLDILFDRPAALSILPFIYMLSSSFSESNLRHLTKELKEISFRQTRRPDDAINERLHDCREKLHSLRSLLSETSTNIPSGLAAYYDGYPKIATRHQRTHLSPTSNHKRILDEADNLDRFLMETFQLLMSSLSIRDSTVGIQQSRRATLITWLAFIYVPLSFVTGIFGMNVKEINGSPLSVWTCFVTLAIVVATTALAFWVYHHYQRSAANIQSLARGTGRRPLRRRVARPEQSAQANCKTIA